MNANYDQISKEETLKKVNTNPQTGLNSTEVKQRLNEFGHNEIIEKKKKSLLMIFLTQLNDPMIFILFIAAGLSLFHKEYADMAIILSVVLLNSIIGMVQESKAESALAALKKLASPSALVKRDNHIIEVPTRDLVIGDIVILEAGRIIPADLRLTFTRNLLIEESAFTGESVPVEKDADFIAGAKSDLGDKKNMAFLSTSVAYGRGEGVVVATAMATEIGKIASILNESKESLTPLQKRLADLGKLLGVAAILICIGMFILALVQSRDFADVLLTAISLAVAAVPEGLPAVVTIVLALGVRRLVKVNTIVRRLPSVETLGSVSIVCSDKTGTLTQNKMTVVQIYQNQQLLAVADIKEKNNKMLIEGLVLCNDAAIDEIARTGDPTELALLDLGLQFAMSKSDLENQFPRINEKAFDSDRKLMTTVHQIENQNRAYTKGAADNIIAICDRINENGQVRPITDEDKKAIGNMMTKMAHNALRVLGLAYKDNDQNASEQELIFIGLVGMIDPPRPEAKAAVEKFKMAGIRTVMITGDHMQTAFAIGKELGIVENENQCISGEELGKMSQEQLNAKVNDLRVFARVSPQHKVMIVKALKSHRYVVSMTGDGVNDAPSLKAADIGVAMGITGTDVAKGASDMILTDDNFATIGKAVEEGRNIYDNIKKFVLFTLSSNLGEVLTIFITIAIGLATPLKAIHILWVNLITDSLPGLALGMDSGDPEAMQRPPRQMRESLFAHKGLLITIGYGLVVTLITLFAFLLIPVSSVGLNLSDISDFLAIKENLVIAQTFAFITLATSQLFHAIGMRNIHRSIFKMNHFANKAMLIALFIGLALQVAITEVPLLTNWFSTAQLSLIQWGQLLLLSLVPLLIHEIVVLIIFIKKKITPVT